MRYLLYGLLALLLLAAGLLALALWHCWELHLKLKARRLTLVLRGFGIKRTVLDRDFSQKEEDSAPKGKPQPQKQPKQKENRFLAKLQADKKRIYDPEQGGYQHGALGQVVQEYRRMWEELKETFSGIFDGMRYKVEVINTNIRLDFGTGNPAHTGMAYSGVWSIIGIFYPMFCRYIKMEYPLVEVTPDFYEKRFDLEITSIIKVRPAHIIHAVLKQGWRMAATYLKKKFNKKGSGNNE
jgi:hypothetical protein